MLIDLYVYVRIYFVEPQSRRAEVLGEEKDVEKQ